MPPKRKSEGPESGGGGLDSGTQSIDKKTKKEKKPKPDFVTIREDTPRRAKGEGRLFKIVSWNVDGLRAEGRDADLKKLIDSEDPDVLCLQETKLPASDPWARWEEVLPGYDACWAFSTAKKGYAGTAIFVKSSSVGIPPAISGEGVITPGGAVCSVADDAPKPKQKDIMSFFAKPKSASGAKSSSSSSSSSSKIGGKQSDEVQIKGCGLPVRNVSFGIGCAEYDQEGRAITVEYDRFFIVNLYVPNSGQKLERLQYRLTGWNPSLQAYIRRLEMQGLSSSEVSGGGKPVVVLGDLNVAHRDVDIYNYFAPHLKKTAGCTMEERSAHSAWLEGSAATDVGDQDCKDESVSCNYSYVDAFRLIHGDVRGAYTYWSMRANNRPENKGLRLDYFICSASMAQSNKPSTAVLLPLSTVKILDSYCLPDATEKSDHAAVSLVLEEIPI